MPLTQIKGHQIFDGTVKKDDINTTDSGQAVITKVIAGDGISIDSTGVDSGTGDVTINTTQSLFTIQSISASSGSTLSPNASTDIIELSSTSGEITLNGTTQIANGSNGKQLILIGTSDSNCVKLVDGANLILRSPEILLKSEKAITLVYLTTFGKWVETSRNVAVSAY